MTLRPLSSSGAKKDKLFLLGPALENPCPVVYSLNRQGKGDTKMERTQNIKDMESEQIKNYLRTKPDEFIKSIGDHVQEIKGLVDEVLRERAI